MNRSTEGRVLLRELAHARAGDKGNRSSICVFAYDPEHYPLLAEQLTPQRLKEEFGGIFAGAVERFELPALSGLNFVIDQGLEGGVNESLNLDGHGKSWSSMILGLTVKI